MRIALVTAYWETIGGIGHYVRELAQELRAAGAEISVLSEDAHAGEGGVVPLPGRSRFGRARAVQRELWRVRPDVIHVHGPWYLLLGAQLAASAGSAGGRPPVLYTQHTLPAEAYRGWKRRVCAALFARCDALLAPTAATLDALEDAAGVPLASPRWAVGAGVREVPPANRMDEPACLGTCGPLVYPEKVRGVADLIEAVARSRNEFPRLRLRVAGGSQDGRAEAELRGLAERLGVAPAVEISGPVRDPWTFLSGVGIYVHPSRRESLPLAILEAMARGLPVVAAAVGGVPELIVPEQSGILVRAGDIAALARAIARLLREPAFAAELGHRARQEAVERWSWRRVAEVHLQLYARVLASRKKRTCVLVASNMYPGARSPAYGSFVRAQVAALSRCQGLQLKLLASTRVPRTFVERFVKYAGLHLKAWANLLRRHDVLHVHFVAPAHLMVLAPLLLLRRRPWVFTAHGSDVHRLARQPYRARYVAWMLRRAAAGLAVSEALQRRLCGQLGLAVTKVHVADVGVDLTKFRPAFGPEKTPLKRALGWEGERVVVFFVGTPLRAKGLDVLLHALGQNELGREIVVAVAGDDPERNKLEGQAEAMGVRVQWLGLRPQRELALCYRAADLFVLPSRAEGRPASLLEAMASGAVVVAAPVGGVPELVRHGENGWLVTGYGAVEWASAIRRLAHEEALRVALARQAWADVEAHALEARVQELATLYARVLGRTQGAS